jgi:hypothetical protein
MNAPTAEGCQGWSVIHFQTRNRLPFRRDAARRSCLTQEGETARDRRVQAMPLVLAAESEWP